MPRVLFLGNCHAQYFASALVALTDVDVRVGGTPHAGVGFRAGAAKFVTREQGIAWLAQAEPGDPAVVVHQTTPHTKTERFGQFAAFKVIRYPFLKFDAPFIAPEPDAGLAFGSEEFEDKLAISRRTDRLFNEISCLKAGWSVDDLEELERLVKTRPILLANSHLAGPGMAWFARQLNKAGLEEVLGAEQARRFESEVAADFGIGFKLWDLPPQLSDSHQFTWWPLPSAAALLERLAADPRELAAALRAGLSEKLDERVAHEIWTVASGMFFKERNLQALRVVLALYRPRRYSRWVRLVVQALIKRGRYTPAALLIIHRLGYGDSRDVFIDFGRELLAKRRMPALARAMTRIEADDVAA